MKSTRVKLARKLTANEAIKRMIVYRLVKHYNVNFHSIGIEYVELHDMWNFSAESAAISVKGYVGCLGQIIETNKNGRQLDIKEFEEI